MPTLLDVALAVKTVVILLFLLTYSGNDKDSE